MKEAIKRLRSIGEKGMRQSNYCEVTDSLALYRQDLELVLHTPTVEELCKVLSEQLKLKVSYGAKQFYYKIENTECVMFVTETYGDGLWSINEYIPPHIITLIGRFYDGLEAKE